MSTKIDIDALPEFRRNGKARLALENFKAEYATDPTAATSAWLLGRFYCESGEFDAASQVLEFGAETFPADHRIFKVRADMLSRCPDASVCNGEAAIEDAKRALKLARNSGWFEGRSYSECQYLETLAAGYAMNGDKKTAIQTLSEAIGVAKTNTHKRRLRETISKIESGDTLVEKLWGVVGKFHRYTIPVGRQWP